MLVNTTINNKKNFSQFYTSYDLGMKMISLISNKDNITNVVDLSIGEGALIDSVIERYPQAKVFGIDIDIKNIKKIKNKYIENSYCFQGDSTTKFAFDKLKSIKDKFDLVVGNPPFSLIQAPENLWNSYPCFFPKTKKIKTENLFLLNGLSLLKDNGILAYILPNGFFTNKSTSNLREFISNTYSIIEIMDVSRGHFSGTEARTHIIIIRNVPPTSHTIKLTRMNDVSKVIYISKEDFIFRGDYNFYHKPQLLTRKVIGQLAIQIIRGNIFNDKNKIRKKDEFLHTTHFLGLYNEFSNSIKTVDDNIRIAKKGDIVIPRVGSRCIGKVGLIISGQFYISDCLIIIRCNDRELTKKVINSLLSDLGQSWFKSIARGVGAKHLTIDDIKMFPIF